MGKAFLREPLLGVFFSAAMGILLADRAAWGWVGGLSLGLLIAGLVARPGRTMAASLFFGTGAGLIVFSLIHASQLKKIHSFPLADALETVGEIEIVGEGWIANEPRLGERSVNTLVRLESFTIGGERIPCRHTLPTWIQQLPTGIEYGTRIRFRGMVAPLRNASAPGGFDPAEFYYRDAGSLARLVIRKGDEIAVLEGRRGSRLVAEAQQWRRTMEEALREGLKERDIRYARLIAAMSLGIREDAPEDLQDLFRLSGTMHLFAVSGMHVGVVGGILVGLAMALRVPRRWAVIIAIPLVLFYAVLTGLRPSAVRAAIMLSVFLAGYAFREKPRLLNSLGVAGCLILIFDTQQLFLPGFQLSFAVLFFIAVLAGALRQGLATPFRPDPFVPRTLLTPTRRSVDAGVVALAALLAVSIASWLGSAGLLTYHFQSLAPVGILANLFMVPLAGLVISLSASSLLCAGLQISWLAALLNQLNVGVAILLTGLATLFSGLPGAHLHTGGPMHREDSAPHLTVDVMGERGEGAVLLTLSGRDEPRSHWLIDCGGEATYRSQVLPTLRSRGVNDLAALVLTHGDMGHIGAAPDLVDLLRPPLLIETTAPNRSRVYPEVEEAVDRLGIERVRVSRGQVIRLDEDLELLVLAPTRERPGRLADDRSLVFLADFRGWRILFTGDAGFNVEKNLLESGTDLEAHVWIRGQHRGSPSGLPSFIEAVAPKAVITTNSDFPANERLSESLVEYAREEQIPVYDLSTAGVVTVTASETELSVTPFVDTESRKVLRLRRRQLEDR